MFRHTPSAVTRHAKIRIAGVLLCAAALTAAHQVTETESAMTEMAGRFLSALSSDQKAAAQYDFDAKQRTLWHFVPDSNFKDTYGFDRPGAQLQGHERRATTTGRGAAEHRPQQCRIPQSDDRDEP